MWRGSVVGKILLGPQGAIRHRRWFAVADYANTFLSALGGLISVAIRLVTSIGFVRSSPLCKRHRALSVCVRVLTLHLCIADADLIREARHAGHRQLLQHGSGYGVSLE
jgi:hypothetical protein